MAWLTRGEEILAPLEVAATPWARTRGLLRRDGIDGALLISPSKAVHTLGMRFPIDVAFCDRTLRIIEVVTMVPNRLGKPRWRARCIIEAEAGGFAKWGVGPGDLVGVRDDRE